MQLTLPELCGGEKRQVSHLCCAECLLYKGARPGGREGGGGRNPAHRPAYTWERAGFYPHKVHLLIQCCGPPSPGLHPSRRSNY